MRTRRFILHSTVTLALVATPLATAVADTSGTAAGPVFAGALSNTPSQRSSQAKMDALPIYVPARTAAGEATTVDYRAADGTMQQRSETKPMVSVFIDDDADPANGDDVWVGYSRDDGTTWSNRNLSDTADKSSFTLQNAQAAPGVVSKPALTLKNNRVLVAWTSTYCADGNPAYEGLAEGQDPYQVGGAQRSVDYADQGYPEVGEVPYKCLWAARATLSTTTGDLVWQAPERLTSGARYAMQIMVNSAPGSTGGFGIAWGEDPDGLNPGSGQGPGEGWTGASPHAGTDVWYSYIKAADFNSAANRFSVPVPISDNGRYAPNDPAPLTGATRPALAFSPQGSTVWAAYGYEETKGVGAEESGGSHGSTPGAIGKNVVHHAFAFDHPDVHSPGVVMNPQMTDSGGNPLYVKDREGNEVPARENARRVRYIAQPVAQMGDSRTLGALIYRMGVYGESGSADFIMQRIVVPDGDTGDPFRAENIQAPVNISATTVTSTTTVDGVTRTVTWKQTAGNLDDKTSASGRESARAHRGFIKGDFLALGYTWTPDWKAALSGKDVENYYVRRSFDGGATFTTTPAALGGDGVRSCEYSNNPATGLLRTPVCKNIGPGQFEPAQNLTRLPDFGQTVIEPRLQGLPGSIAGSPYPEDTQDTSVVWQAWGTGSPKSIASGEEDPEDAGEVPVPDEGSGKGPLDVYYTVSGDYGDTYLANAPIAAGQSIEAESQMRFTSDGSRMSAVWNDYGNADGTGAQDVRFARFVPDLLNTPGEVRLSATEFRGGEGAPVTVTVERVGGRLGSVTVHYETADGTAVAGRDFAATTGSVTFGDKDMTAKTFTVPTLGNNVDAPDKRFGVVLSDASGDPLAPALAAPSSATLTIADDDDTRAPVSKASAPRLTNHVRIPVSYTAVDTESKVTKVVLYVKRPGGATYRWGGVDTTVDGHMSFTSAGRNGVYRFYTRAVDDRGNREAAPARPDTRTRLDTVGPRMSRAWSVPGSLNLSRHRPMHFGFRTDERVSVTFLVRRAGHLVRHIGPRPAGPGVVTQVWYGRREDGTRVHQGAFTVAIKAADRAGNLTRRYVRVVAYR